MGNITLKLTQSGETTAEVDSDEYAAAKAAGELDMMLDAYASDIDCDIEIVEPDGTCIDYSSGKAFQPTPAADMPPGSVVAGNDGWVFVKSIDGSWPGMHINGVPSHQGAVNGAVDRMLAEGRAEVLRVGTGKDAS